MRRITQPAGPKTPVILSGELTAAFKPESDSALFWLAHNQRKLFDYKIQRDECYLGARTVGETKSYQKLSRFPT
jgi:hypothetical protein